MRCAGRVAILLHGYNVMDPRRTVGKFRKHFERRGYLVESYNYGYKPFPIQILKHNPAIAEDVAARCRYWKGKGYEVTLVGHSNGACIIHLADQDYDAPIDKVLAVNPALETEIAVSKKARAVIVVHNRRDTAVMAGGVLTALTRLVLPKKWTARPWGPMGKHGYRGELKTHHNINSGDPIHNPQALGHSGVFGVTKAHAWMPKLARMINAF